MRMPKTKTFRGVLICDIETGQMRLVKRPVKSGLWEVSVDVAIKVNVPEDVRGVLRAEIDIPPMAIEQIEGDPLTMPARAEE